MTDAELITKTLEHMIKVLQAYKNGKTIQVFDTDAEKWFDDENPSFDFSCENYRIKPDRQPQPGEVIAVYNEVIKGWQLALFEEMHPHIQIIAATVIDRDSGAMLHGFTYQKWQFITEQPL